MPDSGKVILALRLPKRAIFLWSSVIWSFIEVVLFLPAPGILLPYDVSFALCDSSVKYFLMFVE